MAVYRDNPPRYCWAICQSEFLDGERTKKETTKTGVWIDGKLLLLVDALDSFFSRPAHKCGPGWREWSSIIQRLYSPIGVEWRNDECKPVRNYVSTPSVRFDHPSLWDFGYYTSIHQASHVVVLYTTALGIKSLFTPIILEHPPELYQSSGTLWRWVYATFRFFHIYIATLIYLFGFVWSYSPSIHPSTPTEEVYGRNKKKVL